MEIVMNINGEINDHAYTWGIAPVSEQDKDDSVAMDVVYFDIVQQQIDRTRSGGVCRTDECTIIGVCPNHDWMPDIDGEHDPDDCFACIEGWDCIVKAPSPVWWISDTDLPF